LRCSCVARLNSGLPTFKKITLLGTIQENLGEGHLVKSPAEEDEIELLESKLKIH
jgi:hypothetical protein